MKMLARLAQSLTIIALLLALFIGLTLDSTRGLHAAEIPANAHKYLPALVAEQQRTWPDAPYPAWLGAQVHKESCITAKHPKCWNPRAELKTEREYGFGLGQITIAYRADGSVRFNKFEELRRMDKRLSAWKWEDRYDPTMQFHALLTLDMINYRAISGAATALDRVAFTAVSYNGGAGSVLYDRRLCQGTKGCDQSRWFGNVENTSGKSRAIMKGYGRSPYDISRDYPRDIINRLMPIYAPYFKGN